LSPSSSCPTCPSVASALPEPAPTTEGMDARHPNYRTCIARTDLGCLSTSGLASTSSRTSARTCQCPILSRPRRLRSKPRLPLLLAHRACHMLTSTLPPLQVPAVLARQAEAAPDVHGRDRQEGGQLVLTPGRPGGRDCCGRGGGGGVCSAGQAGSGVKAPEQHTLRLSRSPSRFVGLRSRFVHFWVICLGHTSFRFVALEYTLVLISLLHPAPPLTAAGITSTPGRCAKRRLLVCFTVQEQTS